MEWQAEVKNETFDHKRAVAVREREIRLRRARLIATAKEQARVVLRAFPIGAAHGVGCFIHKKCTAHSPKGGGGMGCGRALHATEATKYLILRPLLRGPLRVSVSASQRRWQELSESASQHLRRELSVSASQCRRQGLGVSASQRQQLLLGVLASQPLNAEHTSSCRRSCLTSQASQHFQHLRVSASRPLSPCSASTHVSFQQPAASRQVLAVSLKAGT